MKEKFMNAQDEIILLQWRISVKIGIHNSAYFETVLKILLDDNFDFFQEINIEKKPLKIINAPYQMRTHRPFFFYYKPRFVYLFTHFWRSKILI